MNEIPINAPNLWRLDTPGHSGWTRTARAGDPKKYFMVSTDSHANEPPDLWEKRIDAKYRERVPRIITDDQGVQWRYCEGYRPDRVRVMIFEGEDWVRSKAGDWLLGSSIHGMARASRVARSRALATPSSGRTIRSAPGPVYGPASIHGAMAARPSRPLPRASRISSVSAWSSRVCAVNSVAISCAPM